MLVIRCGSLFFSIAVLACQGSDMQSGQPPDATDEQANSKRQYYGVDLQPKVIIAPATQAHMTKHSWAIEASYTSREKVLVLEYETKGNTDCLPLRMIGFSADNAYVGITDSDFVAPMLQSPVVKSIIQGDRWYKYPEKKVTTGFFNRSDRNNPKGIVYVGGFRKNFPDFPAESSQGQRMVSFSIGDIFSRLTKTWYIWSTDPACQPAPKK